MSIKMIVSDLDGTLLQNGARSLNPEIFPLIRKLREQGIIFFAASGRQYPNLHRLFGPVQEEIGYICENGCLGFWKNELLFEKEMEEELGREILGEILRREDDEILRSGRLTSYLQPKRESYLIHIRDVVKNDVTVVNDIFSVREPFTKISVYNEKGIEAQTGFWKERFGTRACVAVSDRCWIDMTPPGADKGTALRTVCGKLGISPEECMVFGDNENDLSMLRIAGEAWGMERSHPEVRKVCRRLTPSVEDVLRRFLEKEISKGEREK